jgi:hypothetical protein
MKTVLDALATARNDTTAEVPARGNRALLGTQPWLIGLLVMGLCMGALAAYAM